MKVNMKRNRIGMTNPNPNIMVITQSKKEKRREKGNTLRERIGKSINLDNQMTPIMKNLNQVLLNVILLWAPGYLVFLEDQRRFF